MNRKFFSSLFLVVMIAVFFLPCEIFAVEMVLKKNPEKSMEVEVVRLTDSDITVNFNDVDLTYPLEEIETLNGMAEISRSKLDELQALGKAYVDQQKYAEAIDLLSKIIDLDPSSLRVIKDLVAAYTKLEKYKEAIPYILKKIELEPNEPQNYVTLGNAYMHLEGNSHYKEAIAAYEKRIEVEGGPTVRNQIDAGYMYCYDRQWEKALSYFQKAMMIEPGSEEFGRHFYEALGFCYHFLGRQQEAISAFQNAIKKADPSKQGQAYHGLGLAFQSLGQTEKAAECERKAKEIGGWSPWW